MSTPIAVQTADERALDAMLDHHARLCADLDDRVAALRTAVADGAPHEEALAALAAFLDGEVLPHAIAEEETLYTAAAGAELFIDAMRVEHRALEDRTRTLAAAGTAVEALGLAEGTAAVFALHVDKENTLLLPALAATPGVSLKSLLEDTQRRLADAPAEPDGAEEDMDVRTLPHGRKRHEVIFGRLDALPVGDRLVIVNDHDPQPLHRRLDAKWPGAYGWDYLASGPPLWRVAITRRA